MGRTQAGFFVDIIYRTLHNVQTATLTGSSAAKSNITDAAKLSWASVMAAIFNAKIRPRQQALAVLTWVSRHLEQKPGATLGPRQSEHFDAARCAWLPSGEARPFEGLLAAQSALDSGGTGTNPDAPGRGVRPGAYCGT